MRYLLLAVFLLAVFLRLIGIADVPAGFTPDEASFGYDAYSILKTGKDQWGHPLPLVFKSFGDYKLPLYTYITIPSVYFFGLNEFAVRLPNALVGSFAVLAVYLLAKEIGKKIYEKDKDSLHLSLLSALLLAVSPWHVQLSRGAFEANITALLLPLAVYFFLKGTQNNKFFPLSAFFFSLNTFSYHSARIVSPIILLILLWFFWTKLKFSKQILFSLLIFLGFFVMLLASIGSGSLVRSQTSTLFTMNLGSGEKRAVAIQTGMNPLFAKIMFNEPLYKVQKVAANYAHYLSTSFFVSEGARESTYGMIPGNSLLLLPEAVGLVTFLFYWIKKPNNKYISLLCFWVLIGLLPASISIGPGGAANRASVVMPSIQVLAGIGIMNIISKSYIRLSAFSLVTLILGLVMFNKYYFAQPAVAGYSMMYGMREVFRKIEEIKPEKIVLSRSISEAHMFAAFYTKIDPKSYQEYSKSWDFESKTLSWVDQLDPYFIGNYKIASIDKIVDFKNKGTLVVGKPDEIPQNATLVSTFYAPGFTPIWVIAQKNE